MTHAAPNPEDRQQLDALASRLAELQPAPASGNVQAQAFYLAGMQAARAEMHRRRASSRWLASVAVVGLVVGSSGLSYWVGVSRGRNIQLAATPLVAEPVSQIEVKNAERLVVDPPGLPPHAPNNNVVNALPLEQSAAPEKLAGGMNTEFRQVAFSSPIARWLKLPRVTPDEYMRLVEARTTPPPPSHRADEAHASDRSSEESLLRELYGTPPPSPLQQWLPLL